MAEVRPPRFGLAAATGWCFGTTAVLVAVIELALMVFPGAQYDMVSLGAILLLVLGSACFLLSSIYVPEPGRSDAQVLSLSFGVTPTRALALGLGLSLGISIKFPADALSALIERYYPLSEVERAIQSEQLRHDNLGQVIGLVVVVGIVGPVVEELLYRGIVFKLLQRARGTWVASVFVTIAFALAHLQPRAFVPLLLVSAVLTFLRARTETIWASVAGHVAFNCSTLIGLFLGFSQVQEHQPIGIALPLAGLAVTAGLIVAAQRARFDGGGIV